MNYRYSQEFDKDLKRLSKKWRSLPSDVEYSKNKIENLYIKRDDIDINQYRADLFSTKKAAILPGSTNDIEVVKMCLDVAYLGRSDKVRIIFVTIRSRNEILYIELYAKNEKSREDQKRIKKYLEIAK
jgi:pyrimidine operon attenuation protein/uracil phosphoribosyltransferase